MKIKEVQDSLVQRLSRPLKDALRDLNYQIADESNLRVSLRPRKDTNERKTRSDASSENWSPYLGEIIIALDPTRQDERLPISGVDTSRSTAHTQPALAGANLSATSTYIHPAEAELLRALDRAESTPGWSFVPLKKFRDEILPLESREDCPSLGTDVAQHTMLRSVIEKRFVLVGKVPNPKSPQFPVTTIRLNRLMPEVKTALRQSSDTDSDFQPIEISGEPLSATILRERR